MNLDKVKLYYISFNLYSFSSGMIGIFINFFVLATSSLLGVVYFNILYFGGLELSYFACAFVLDRFEPKDMYVYGTLIRAFTLLLFLGAAVVVSNILIFGLLYGMSIGTFWLGNNILNSDISKGMDRQEFVYKNSLITSVVSFIAPTLAGVMVQYSQFSGPLRFLYDFVGAFLLLAASAYTLALAKIPRHARPLKYRLRDSFIRLKGYNDYKIYFMLLQIFQMPFLLILPIYVLQITGSYVIAGTYASAILIITIFANYLVKINRKYWNGLVRILVVSIIISSVPILIPQIVSPILAVYIFTAIYTIASTPLNIQASSNFIDLIDESAKDRIHFWMNREIYITTGRAIILTVFVLILLYAPNNIAYLIYLLPFLSIYSVIYFKVCKRADENVKIAQNLKPSPL